MGLIIFINLELNNKIKIFILFFFLISNIYILILCYFLNDFKIIIAYFSVSHISLVLISFFLKYDFRNIRIILIMIAHSISSPLLFFFNNFLYLNYSSRILNKLRSIFIQRKLFL